MNAVPDSVAGKPIGRAAQLLDPSEGVPQNWAALRDYLATQGMRLDMDEVPRQFAGGLGNLNYLLHIDGNAVVMRRPPPGRKRPARSATPTAWCNWASKPS